MEKQLFCTQCQDGQLIRKNGRLVCKYCGTVYEDGSDAFAAEIRHIAARRQMREFLQAEELCDEFIAREPKNAEVYWQLLLTRLGVVYVIEDGTAKPTFFGYSYNKSETVEQDEAFKNCLKNASLSARENYIARAAQLDRLLKAFFELVDRENSYDIFISFKQNETNETKDGEIITTPTRDSKKAAEIYEYLTRRGYKVFFSPVSIGMDAGLSGEKYEPRILKALQTSQAMILLGSKTKYLSSEWVENEWRRYLYYMDKGRKRRSSLILGYEESMPALPSALKDRQWRSFDMFKAAYLSEVENLVSFVKSAGVLDTVQIAAKTGRKKLVRSRSGEFTGTKLSVTADDETSLGVDKELRIIGSDLPTARRSKAIKQLERLKKELEDEGRKDGRVLMLDLVVKAGLSSADELKIPANLAAIPDISVFKDIIAAGGPKEWLHSLLDTLYDYAMSEESDIPEKVKALEIATPYDYPRRTDKIGRALRRAAESGWEKVFDMLITRAGLSDEQEAGEIIRFARGALVGARFAAAARYAGRVLDEYDDGNIPAKDILLLAESSKKSYDSFFAPINAGHLSDADFERLKDILSYMSDEKRIEGGEEIPSPRAVRLAEWNRNVYGRQSSNIGNNLRTFSDAEREGLRLTREQKKSYESTSAAAERFMSFYDRFLAFFPKEEQQRQVVKIADEAARKRLYTVALHYYGYALADAKDKAYVYYKMMLADLGCKTENELYDLTIDITDNEYFIKALKAAEGEQFKRLQDLRVRQLDSAEANRHSRRIKKADARNFAIGSGVRMTAAVLAPLSTAFVLVSVVLAFAGLAPFYDIWHGASVALVGSSNLLIVAFFGFGLALAIELALLIKHRFFDIKASGIISCFAITIIVLGAFFGAMMI